MSPEEITAAARRECAEWGIGFDQFVAAGRGGRLSDGDQRDWWLIYGDLFITDEER